MKKKKAFHDLIMLGAGVILALLLVYLGIVANIVTSLNTYGLVGVFVAGMLFTSAFTTATSIVLLGTFGLTVPLPVLALLGGLGAMFGDFVIFSFVKNRLSNDLDYLLSFSGRKRFPAIFRTRFFRLFVPFVGALIIASPLPDEIGVAMLGFSKMKSKVFLPISFVMNSLGVFAIGLVARAIVNG
jgi:hypothetical protein